MPVNMGQVMVGFRAVRAMRIFWAFVIRFILALAAIAGSVAVPAAIAQSQSVTQTYNAGGLPQSFPKDQTVTLDFPISVTENYLVEDVSLSIEMFHWLIGYVDIWLISPDGTQVTVGDYYCPGAPISFGTRIYDIADAQVGVVPTGTSGVPATYTWESGGALIGADNSDQTSACWEYWNSWNIPNPQTLFPTWPTTAPNSTNGQLWHEKGAFKTLPSDITWRPHDGDFSAFTGKQTQGDWILRMKIWGTSRTEGWVQADRELVSASVTLSGAPIPPEFTVATDPSTIEQGDTTTLSYTVDNSSSTIALSGLQFSSTLPSGLEISTPVTATDTCGGSLTTDPSSRSLSYSVGSVSANATCEITLAVTGAQAGTYQTSTSALQSSAGTSTATEASLTVNATPTPSLALAFAPASIEQGGTSVVTYTLTNNSSLLAVNGLGFTHDLSTDLEFTDVTSASNSCNGTLSVADGPGTLSLTGGTIPVSGTCTISVSVTSAVAGTYSETTSVLASSFGDGAAAIGDLTVTAASAPSLALAFAPASIEQGGTTVATYTLTNNSSLLAADGLGFTHDLSTNLEFTDTANASNTCNGTLSVADGPETLSLSDGTIPTGGTCTISVSLTSDVTGTYSETTSVLASSLGDDAAASGDLTVTAAQLPGFAASFDPTLTEQLTTSRLTFVIDNTAAPVVRSGLQFTSTLPFALSPANPANLSDTCGGTLSVDNVNSSVSYSGGTVPANASCQVAIDIFTNAEGDFQTSTTALQTSDGSSIATEASLTVTAVPAPSLAMAFAPSSIEQGDTSVVTYTLTNNAAGTDMTGLEFSHALSTGLEFTDAASASNTCGGTLDVADGPGTLSFTGGTIPVGETCEISVAVTSAVDGSYPETTSVLVSNFSQGAAASATLTVTAASAPGLALAFAPGSIEQGDTSVATYTLTNHSTLLAVDGLSFTHDLSTNLEVTDAASASNTCGGTLSVADGAGTLSLTDGTIPAGGTCTISVSLTSAVTGSYSETTSVLASSFGDGAAASGNLNVTAAGAPSLALAFAPSSIEQGDTTQVTYTLNNASSLLPVDGLGFTHDLSADLEVTDAASASNSCGGSLSVADGPGSLSLTGGTAPAGGSCTISVSMTSAVSGTYSEMTSLLASSFGDGAAGSADLTVTAASAPGLALAFTPASIEQGDTTVVTYTLTNNSALLPVDGLGFTHDLSADLEVTDATSATNTCNGTLSVADGPGTVGLTGGTIPAGGTCTIDVSLTSVVAGTYGETTSVLASDFGQGTAASAELTVTSAAAPGLALAFAPASIEQGDTTVITYTLTNRSSLLPVNGLGFSHTLLTDLEFSDAANASNTCGGTLSVADGPGTLDLTGGTIAAGETCTISVAVTSPVAGTYAETTSVLSSDFGEGAEASSELTVTSAAAPTLALAFDPPEINAGASTLLTYTIDNRQTLIPVNQLSFADELPTELLVDGSVTPQSDCQGAVTASEGSNQISLDAGIVGASEICTITIAITSDVPALYSSNSVTLSSSLGTSTTAAAAAELNVLDVTPPTVEIESDVETFTDLSGISVRFTFSEAVTGFELSDITVGSGAASNFGSVSSTEYTAIVTPSGKGNLTISVPAGAAQDTSASANGNIASEELVIGNGIIALTQRAIRNFIAGRMDTIVSNEPDLFERLTRRSSPESSGGSGFAANYTAYGANISFDTSLASVRANMMPKQPLPFQSSIMRKTGLFAKPDAEKDNAPVGFDIWAKGTYSHTKNEARRSDTGLLYIGADWMLNPDLVVGLLTQFDWTAEDVVATKLEVEGFGWMAGPYAIQRLSESLILDGRVALGKSSNQINPIGLYTDDFDTDRILFSSQLTGSIEWETYEILPFFQAVYMEERQNDYTDSLGNLIDEQTLSLGRFQFGPKIRTQFEGPDGTLFAPYMTFAGLYDFEGGRTTDLEGMIVSQDRLRGRYTGGVNMIGVSGWNVSSEMFYDGIGQDSMEAFGFSVNINLTF